MKETSRQMISDIIEELDKHVSRKQDFEYPKASMCSQYLKDVCKDEGVAWEK